MARAFVAVVPPGEVLDAVEGAVARARLHVRGARWSSREQCHVTLQFLGNEADLDAVAAGLGALDAVSGPVRLGGAGAFPRPRRATVLWLGLTAGAEMLRRLAADVGGLLAHLGHEPDGRSFRPHLSLARLTAPADMRGVIDALGPDPVGPEWTPASVALVESRLGGEGPRYRVHAEMPLG